METELDKLHPDDRKLVIERARESGCSVAEVVADLVHRALEFEDANGAHPTGEGDPAFESSKTELGRTLRALSRRYVETGGRLYSLDEINAEVAESRGQS